MARLLPSTLRTSWPEWFTGGRNSGEQREAIYRLRHNAYLREDAISANLSGTFSDSYDETDNAYLFGMYIDDQLASSLRLHAASREHPDMPSDICNLNSMLARSSSIQPTL
jgi:hypothetical protein